VRKTKTQLIRELREARTQIKREQARAHLRFRIERYFSIYKQLYHASLRSRGGKAIHTDDVQARAKARELANDFLVSKAGEPLSEGIAYAMAGLQDGGFRAYEKSTVRGWIADLFPPALRKPGRPKKSPVS
jgi:hypothetical protein